jgi:hypothetical protein
LAGHDACWGGFKKSYVICRLEKLSGKESSKQIVFHNSMEEISSDALIQMEDIIIIILQKV